MFSQDEGNGELKSRVCHAGLLREITDVIGGEDALLASRLISCLRVSKY